MATDNGLVSYNGYAFKSYTTKDGLPDNEIFSICEDIQHRLWLKPFAKELCYLWKGKIYSQHNDPVLRQIKLRNAARFLKTDRWGNVFVSEDQVIIRISPSGKVEHITQLGKNSLSYVSIKTDTAGVLIAINKNQVYRYQRDHFELEAVFPASFLPDYINAQRQTFITAELCWTPVYQFLSHYNSDSHYGKYYTDIERIKTHFFEKVSDTSVALCMADGLRLKDLRTGQLRERFFEGYNIAYAMPDKDGNLWIGTLGEGAFRISRTYIRSVPLSKRSESIRFLHAESRQLIVGSDNGTLALVHYTGSQARLLWERQIDPVHVHEQCTYAGRQGNGQWLIGLGSSFRLYTSSLRQKRNAPSSRIFNKSAVTENQGRLLVGTPSCMLRIDTRQVRILDTLLADRITSVAKLKHTIYAGTLNGLYTVKEDAKEMTRCNLPELAGHITALCADSILWVANNGGNLFAVSNNNIIARLGRNDGLVCNHITAIKASDSLIWIGTDEGLYAVTKQQPLKIVRHISQIHGLPSDEVRYLEVTGDIIWAGTNKGLSYFKEQEMVPVHQQASFLVTALRNEDVILPPALQTTVLKGRTLRIDFDVIDQSGIGQPKFAYRLNEGKWIELDNNYLYFPTLPYGDFTVRLRANSPGWAEPKMVQMPFYRPYPVYLRWWFILSYSLAGLLLLTFLAKRYLTRQNRKERERLLTQQNLLQLEQLALQGQMNSHFIFNCIVAIRQYYNKGDTARANRFVDAFSILVRTTFEMVNQTFIPLDKELKYLEQYLKVEQERFNHSFRFTITTEISASAFQIPVPTMLLQPLTENAVKHGVRSLPDGMGAIQIGITQRDGQINITIEDNGTGRKRNQHIDVTGRSVVSITSTTVNQKRIDILNQLFNGRISMQTADITDREGRIAGTRVTLTYPLDIYELTP